MCERYPSSYIYGGHPVSSWDRPHFSHSLERNFNSLENQIQHQHRARLGSTPRYWGSMSEGGGVSGGGDRDNAKTNLIVNYLPQTMTEKDLYAMFMTIGPIESCRVMKDFKTGYSYGFGFVNFTREEDAARAIETFNGYQLRNKRLKVSYARPSGEDIKDTNLYVTNLPRAITEEQLETIFGKYGRIVQKHILRDKSNGTPRGVAFVRFDKREEAQEAIAALNNVIPEGGTEPLSVKPACVGLLRGGAHALARRASYSARGHANTYTHRDRDHSLPHRDSYSLPREAYSLPHRDTYRDAHRDSYTHRDAHSLPRDAYSMAHRDSYSYPMSLRNSNSLPNRDAYSLHSSSLPNRESSIPLRNSNSLPNRDAYSLYSSSLPNRESSIPLRNSSSLPHRSSQRDVYSLLSHRVTASSLLPHRDASTLPASALLSKERSQTPGPMIAEEHGKQKAAYYAGWAAGFHHNRGDFEWDYDSCIMPDPWDKFQPPPLGGSYPGTPRNGCRPVCPNPRMYPNYLPGKGRPNRGRNLPWAPGPFGEGYKGQRFRNGPAPYW